MKITVSKVRPRKLRSSGRSPRVKIHKSIHNQLSHKGPGYSTGESTCESSGVSMNCSEEFSTIEQSDDFSKSRDLTQMTTGPQSGSLLPSSASEVSEIIDESEAIYYFGYGSIVNPIVRIGRGCTIPPENIQTAILYDHRLKFVAGGTANIVKSRGWDVKGVLLKFNNLKEWEAFRQYDANYDVVDVKVSVIDKTNLDPKKKNNSTAPFEESDDFDESIRSQGLISSHRMYRSTLVSANASLNDLSEDSSSEEEDYSCPFSFEPKSAKADPNAVNCKTFMIDQPAVSHVINENSSFRGKGFGVDSSVYAKPQERYLKLMTDGLRMHDVDEAYIRDEVLTVTYIPNERDKVVDHNYRSFPVSKKFTKMSQNKYESKVSKYKDKTTHIVIGNKIIKIDGEPDLSNPCIRWLRAHGDGNSDITLSIHQTFIDKDSFHLRMVNSHDELTEDYRIWAEHMVFLYLERGDLTATVIGELTDGKPGFGNFLKNKMNLKRSRRNLTSNFLDRSERSHIGGVNRPSSLNELQAPSSQSSLRGGTQSHHSRSIPIHQTKPTVKRVFGGAMGKPKKKD